MPLQGNFIGSVLLSLLFFNTETMSEPGIATAVAIAEKKIHSDFGTQVLKGMMCNWLVCIALWQVTLSAHLVFLDGDL